MAAILQKYIDLILNKPNSPADLNVAVASAVLLVCLQIGRKMSHVEANMCQTCRASYLKARTRSVGCQQASCLHFLLGDTL